MIVELVGLPGSGKSTLARTLEHDGKWKRAKLVKRHHLVWYALCFVVRHPVSAVKQIFFLWRYRGHLNTWYTKFANLFVVHNAQYMKASYMPFAILDQGHIQNIYSLFDVKQGKDVLATYFAILPLPDVVLFFDVEQSVREARLTERAHTPRSALLTGEAYQSWVDAYEAHHEWLRESLKTRIPTIVLGSDALSDSLPWLTHPRIVRFVMHARMPTEKAHGLQIAKTLEALCEAGVMAELWVPKRNNPIAETVVDYYGLRKQFPVRNITSLHFLRFAPALGAVAYWLDACAFLLSLLLMRLDKGVMSVTRSPLLCLLFAIRGCPVTLEVHSLPKRWRGLFALFVRTATHVVANSQGTQSALLKLSIPEVTVIQNGVDVSRFRRDVSRVDARTTLGLTPHLKYIVYAGSFGRWKGVATLYLAWVSIQSRFPDTRLLLVGGEQSILEAYPECTDITSDMQTIVIPHQSVHQIPFYLSAGDVLVLPNEPVSEESIHFTSPIKLYEYLAVGREVVVSDLPAIRDAVGSASVTFAKAGESASWARVLAGILESPQREVPHFLPPTWNDRATLLSALFDQPRNTTL